MSVCEPLGETKGVLFFEVGVDVWGLNLLRLGLFWSSSVTTIPGVAAISTLLTFHGLVVRRIRRIRPVDSVSTV